MPEGRLNPSGYTLAPAQEAVPARKGRIFYGWRIVAVSWLSVFFGVGITFYTYGVFFVLWQKEFGWNRALISGAFAVGAAAPALLMPFLGSLINAFGSKKIMIVGATIMGLGYLLLSTMTAPWQLFVYYTIGALGFTAFGHVTVATTLAKWFARRRGLALGLTHTGMGAGGILLTPLTTILAQNIGWRTTAAVLGLAVWVILIPLFILVIKSRPQDIGLLPDNDEPRDVPLTAGVGEGSGAPEASSEGATAREAIRSSIFWILVFAFVAQGIANVGVLSQQIPYLTDLKFSLAVAALFASVSAAMHLSGKVIFGILADRISPRVVLALGFSCGFLGIVSYLFAGNVGIAFAGSAFLGLSGAVTTVMQPIVVGRFFGNRHLGTILGLLFAITTFGLAFGPVISGLVFDITGTYKTAFLIYAGAVLLAIAVPLLMKPPGRAVSRSPRTGS